MSDCRFGVSPVNYPDPDPDFSCLAELLNLEKYRNSKINNNNNN